MVCETIRARVAAGTLLAAFLIAGSVPALAAPIKNIVLVHGAWVDGSDWKPVYEILVRGGYHVSVVQEPLTSLRDDACAGSVGRAARTGREPPAAVCHSSPSNASNHL